MFQRGQSSGLERGRGEERGAAVSSGWLAILGNVKVQEMF